MKEIPPNNNLQVNLTNCDKEEIHLLGKIQSNGNLLAFEIANWEIRFYSQEINELFGIGLNQLLSSKINELFDKDLVNFFLNFTNSNQDYIVYEDIVDINNKKYQIYISKALNYIIIEFEYIEDINFFYKELAKGFYFIEQSLNSIDKAENEKLLSNSTVNLFRAYTGFDRVMIYKFDENGDGDVIAEDKTIGLESLYGNHYPASDIPKQARLLYLKNKVRAINDVDDEGKNIIFSSLDSGNHTEESSILDLSFSLFRHVSPIHLQYMKNMGVKASHSVSIVVDNKLWGLIICHHCNSEKFLDINRRMNTVIFGNLFSNKIAMLNIEKYKNKIVLFKQIIEEFKYDKYKKNINSVLESKYQQIFELFSCHLLCYLQNDNMYFFGDKIDKVEIEKIESILKFNQDDIFCSNSIIKNGLSDSSFEKFAGMMRIKISNSDNHTLYLFRIERKKTLTWAGNPNQFSKNIENIHLINPRNSFEKWIEQIEYESEEWTDEDKDYAVNLRNAIISFEIEHLKQKSTNILELESINSQLQNLLETKAHDLEILNSNLQNELKEKENQKVKLEILKNSSEQLVKIKSDILANLSHEMRTPLNGIMGISMIIKSGVDNSELVKLVDLQIESCQRLVQTINRIVELSKIENSSYNFNYEIVDIKKLIQKTIQMFELLAKNKNQSIKVIFHQNDNLLFTDALIFEHIFSNLLSNSIKYTQEFGNIEVNWKWINEDSKEYYLLQVEDNGIGIAKENFDNIFHSFFLENEASKQKDNSTGLGLYLVKNYVKYLNGEVYLESEKNVGSKFTVKFPVNSIK